MMSQYDTFWDCPGRSDLVGLGMDTSENNFVEDMWSQMCINADLDNDKAVYVLKDVAEIFGVSMSTVRRWSNSKKLNSWLLGPRKRVVAIQELKRYLAAQVQPVHGVEQVRHAS